MKIIVALLLTSLLIDAKAQAAWIVDPYAGYAFGQNDAHAKAQVGLPDGLDVGSKFTEISLGFKLGYQFGSFFWFAADPEVGLTGMSKDNSTSYSSGYTRTQVFVDAGIDVGIFRAYLGYAALNQIEFGDGRAWGGLAYKAGLEAEIIHNAAIFAEYHSTGYKSGTGSNGDFEFANQYDKFTETRIVVGLAFPFDGISDTK